MANTFLFFCAISGVFLAIASWITYDPSNFLPRFDSQQEIEYTKKSENLFTNGSVTGEGWARHSIWRYMRGNIRHSKLRIKEWDYYATYVGKLNMWICMTVSDLGYAGLFSLAVIDLNTKKFSQLDDIKILPLGKTHLPPTSLHDHDLEFVCKGMNITFSKDGKHRSIRAVAPNFVLPNGEKGIDADLAMVQSDSLESINIQTTWNEDRSLFYLNEKVNGLESRGTVTIGGKTTNVLDNSYTVLDWGRGVWSYQNRWYWSSAFGKVGGHKVGFNFGYGFSDRSPATENVIFYDDKIHKLDDVKFNIPEGYMDEWTMTSKDGRVNLKFVPDVDRKANMNFIIIKSDQNQVFGTFSGTLVLDDGTKVEISDIKGFAEDVFNRW